MSSLKADFSELVEKLRTGREVGHASFEPIFYLVFHPTEILEVKRSLPAWEARLRNEGWNVHKFSIVQAIQEILDAAPLKKIWLAADAKAPMQWEKTNKSLANALTNGSLQNKLEAVLASLEGQANNILLVTDIEALHPYLRIGSIENQLHGRFHVSTVFFYPGVRTGTTRLKFLGFYPEDGNYRSSHIGSGEFRGS